MLTDSHISTSRVDFWIAWIGHTAKEQGSIISAKMTCYIMGYTQIYKLFNLLFI